MAITLKQLHFLVTIAKYKQFTLAAETIGVTQPAMSAAIKDLEATLGKALLERNSKGCRLTPFGEKTVKHAYKILMEAEKLTILASDYEPLSGEFRLGSISTIAPYLIPFLLQPLKKSFPSLTLELKERYTDWILNALSHKELDAAIIALPYKTNSEIQSLELGREGFHVILPNSHPLTKKQQITLKDIDTEELILLKNEYCLTLHVLKACKKKSDHSIKTFRATSLPMLIQIVAQGAGISLIPNMVLKSSLIQGFPLTLKPLQEKNSLRRIGYVWNKNSVRQKDIKLMGNYLKAFYANVYA